MIREACNEKMRMQESSEKFCLFILGWVSLSLSQATRLWKQQKEMPDAKKQECKVCERKRGEGEGGEAVSEQRQVRKSPRHSTQACPALPHCPLSHPHSPPTTRKVAGRVAGRQVVVVRQRREVAGMVVGRVGEAWWQCGMAAGRKGRQAWFAGGSRWSVLSLHLPPIHAMSPGRQAGIGRRWWQVPVPSCPSSPSVLFPGLLNRW